jgi:hypothetical protein
VIANVRRGGINQTRHVADGKTERRGDYDFRRAPDFIKKLSSQRIFYLKLGDENFYVYIKRWSVSSSFFVCRMILRVAARSE